MVNGIRLVPFSLSVIPAGKTEIGTDKFGQDQILIGVLPRQAGTLQEITVEAEQWGNRRTIVPAAYDPTAAGAGGFWKPPIYSEVIANSTITVSGTKSGVIAEVMECLLILQIKDPTGTYPASMAEHIGELHTQFATGTATAGSFGDTATQDILNELPNDEWMPLMCAQVGGSSFTEVKYTHPFDEGFPPVGIGVLAVGLGDDTFQALPPTNVLRGADTMTFKAKDVTGLAIRMYLYTGRVTNGMTVKSNRTPYSL